MRLFEEYTPKSAPNPLFLRIRSTFTKTVLRNWEGKVFFLVDCNYTIECQIIGMIIGAGCPDLSLAFPRVMNRHPESLVLNKQGGPFVVPCGLIVHFRAWTL